MPAGKYILTGSWVDIYYRLTGFLWTIQTKTVLKTNFADALASKPMRAAYEIALQTGNEHRATTTNPMEV
jgi:hypothetical protein